MLIPQQGRGCSGYQFEILYRNDSRVKNFKTTHCFSTTTYETALASYTHMLPPPPGTRDFNSFCWFYEHLYKNFGVWKCPPYYGDSHRQSPWGYLANTPLPQRAVCHCPPVPCPQFCLHQLRSGGREGRGQALRPQWKGGSAVGGKPPSFARVQYCVPRWVQPLQNSKSRSGDRLAAGVLTLRQVGVRLSRGPSAACLGSL